MSQSVNLSVSGLYTSSNDMNGTPPGAMTVAMNVESRYKNLLGPRRGFEDLPNTAIALTTIRRMINFFVTGIDSTVALTSSGYLKYYNETSGVWSDVPGSFSSGITAPNSINAKSRFVKAGQNLYITSKDGIRSLSSGSTAKTIRAGVPKALNLEAVSSTDYEEIGFLGNNTILSTTGSITSGSANLTQIADTSEISVGQFVGGSEVVATRVIQDLKYSSELFGVLGNAITIAYTTGAIAGSEVVSVSGQNITVQIQSGVSTANQIRTAVIANTAASNIVSVSVSGVGTNTQTGPVSASNLTGGLDNNIPIGTKVISVTKSAPIMSETGDMTAGSPTVSNLISNTGLVAGVLVSGDGIPDGTEVVSVSGAGPYTVVMSNSSYKTGTGVTLTFSSPLSVTMDQNALATNSSTAISFYYGSQVGYRLVFGRVETDINGKKITRIGSPSTIAIATNNTPYPINVDIDATIPKNSSDALTFVQIYRSVATESIDITPVDQYQLVYEANLTPTDFTNRFVSIVDATPDSLKGIPLYAGSDREGILQSNDPPPMAWDVCPFRDFMIYGNITQPSTLKFTIDAVGGTSGIQIGDTITISGSILGVSFTRTYTAAVLEDQVNNKFQIYTSGTPGQNIADTANSLIRVINYDEALPIHAILYSTSTDLPGQILLESDRPGYDTFTITASAHQTAYDPTLNNVVSDVNTVNNGLLISKSGELEAVPGTNILYAGDSSSDILRVIPLRDYVIVLKTDGVYKLQGLSPSSCVCNAFDLTTKIIGADTAVSLNSGVWMLSNQGVVSVSDGGVDAKSLPIDDQFNRLIGSYLDNLADVSFAVGYESDRKYVLCVPENDESVADLQYVFNYVTSSWTMWNRRLTCGYINSKDGKLYIGRNDSNNQTGISRERKTGTYKDYVDESISLTLVSVGTGYVLQLDDVSQVSIGDIFYQDGTNFSPILDIDLLNNTITVESSLNWTPGAIQILKAFSCDMTWKQVFGDNPAFVRQFSEGIALFKNTRFNTATLNFVTDFNGSSDPVEVQGVGSGLWGLFQWGMIPWGGTALPDSVRFYIPQDKQLGSYIIPSLNIKQGYSDFQFQGLSISYSNVSQELGK